VQGPETTAAASTAADTHHEGHLRHTSVCLCDGECASSEVCRTKSSPLQPPPPQKTNEAYMLDVVTLKNQLDAEMTELNKPPPPKPKKSKGDKGKKDDPVAPKDVMFEHRNLKAEIERDMPKTLTKKEKAAFVQQRTKEVNDYNDAMDKARREAIKAMDKNSIAKAEGSARCAVM
jgi:hypothetical protein